ncbi:MAG TPA: RNA methyltransferase [Balneolales bacterium]|nr:RNA methyltransferase [Balneolales bacterium]
MNKSEEKSLLEYLTGFLTEDKIELFQRILDNRTRYITVVLEDIYQPHNASAVLRSCDGFGVQDVHIIENYNEFEVNNGVTIGAHKWLTLQHHNTLNSNNSQRCMKFLREKGYRVVATTPHEHDYNLSDLPIDQKTALFFGAEKKGLTEEVLREADEFVKIPMYGFSESFNISVSVAVTLYEVISRLRKTEINWHLNEKEKEELVLEWVRKSVRGSDLIEQRFRNEASF